MHKVFISHHHANDQWYKDRVVEFGEMHSIFLDRSVDTGDIPDHWSDERIRQAIRDNYLRDSTVTIVLVGEVTRRRKHVDWEIYSSMYDGAVNKKSGIVVINLPGISDAGIAPYDREKAVVYPDVPLPSWTHVGNRAECNRRYPYMPERIVDNLVQPGVKISVVPWQRLNASRLEFLIDAAFANRTSCPYDLSRPMRRANS